MPYSVHYLMHYACQDQHQALIRQQHLHEGKTQQTRHCQQGRQTRETHHPTQELQVSKAITKGG